MTNLEIKISMKVVHTSAYIKVMSLGWTEQVPMFTACNLR